MANPVWRSSMLAPLIGATLLVCGCCLERQDVGNCRVHHRRWSNVAAMAAGLIASLL